MKNESGLPITVIRATDAAWSDGKHHDRFILRVAEPDRMYQFEGWIRFGQDYAATPQNIIAGISRQDRETGRLTIFIETHAGRWKPIGFGQLDQRHHMMLDLHDPQGEALTLRARVLDTLPVDMLTRLYGEAYVEDEPCAKLDLEIQTAQERRSHFKVV